MSDAEPNGSMVVEPVHKAAVDTPIPPIVARTDDFEENHIMVYAFVVLLGEYEELMLDVEDNQGNPIESLYVEAPDTRQCMASAPTELNSNNNHHGGGGGGSSSSAAAAGGQHLYFAFKNLRFRWPGTYLLAIDIWTFDPTDATGQGAKCVDRIVSRKITIVEGGDPGEEPSEDEKSLIRQIRRTKNLRHFRLPRV